ncbi:MAG: hypothetical protein P1P64_06955 [Treponemataceae bacterium]
MDICVVASTKPQAYQYACSYFCLAPVCERNKYFLAFSFLCEVYALAFNLRSALSASEFYWCSMACLSGNFCASKIPARLCQTCVVTHR